MSFVTRRLSSFGMFLVKSKGHPSLSGIHPKKRAKLLGQMWGKLSVAQKAEYAASAKRGYRVEVKPAPTKKPKVLSAYIKFMKVTLPKMTGNGNARVKQAAKLWKQKKQL
jgi:hypothetical protein